MTIQGGMFGKDLSLQEKCLNQVLDISINVEYFFQTPSTVKWEYNLILFLVKF